MGEAWALAALLPLLSVAGPSLAAPPAPAERLPEWLLGNWTAVEVRQDKNGSYDPDSGPIHWWQDATMTVTPDRLTFNPEACEVGSVQAKRAPISVPVRHGTGVGLDAFGLPSEPKPVNYLAIKCARSLLGWLDGHGPMDDRGTKLTWYVVVRSPTEIDMPFLYSSYVKFRKASPTS